MFPTSRLPISWTPCPLSSSLVSSSEVSTRRRSAALRRARLSDVCSLPTRLTSSLDVSDFLHAPPVSTPPLSPQFAPDSVVTAWSSRAQASTTPTPSLQRSTGRSAEIRVRSRSPYFSSGRPPSSASWPTPSPPTLPLVHHLTNIQKRSTSVSRSRLRSMAPRRTTAAARTRTLSSRSAARAPSSSL